MSEAVMMATVANGGTRVMPHLVKAIDEGKGWQPVAAPAPKPVRAVGAEARDDSAIHDGLWLVVNGAGTGARARCSPATTLPARPAPRR